MSKFTRKRDRRPDNKKGSCGDRVKVDGRESNDSERSTDYNAQRSKPNDWRWYAQNEQLLRDSSSFPYSWPLGNKLNLGVNAPEVNKGSLPGVMAIWTTPTFGWSDNPNSPVNVAARNVYSFVRHANSGHANYDAPDLMLYMCAMDSIYSYLAFLKRVYGVISTYSYTNRYYPKAVVTAMTVDYDDIQRNLADFRGFINSFAVKVGSMCIPASMSYMAKHMWMYSGLYFDSDQDKAQTYLFVPNNLYRYALDQDGAGMLEGFSFAEYYTTHGTTDNDPSYINFEGLRKIADDMLDPILRSEDMNIMSGDILKAFGPGGIYKVEGIGETYTVLPSYEPEVLDQIQNLTLVGLFKYAGHENMTQDGAAKLCQDPTKGWLVSKPLFNHPYRFTLADEEFPGQNVFISDRIVTFEHGDITPANTMEATRMCNIAREYSKEHTDSYEVHTLGSEAALFARIYYYVQGDVEWELQHTQQIFTGLTHILNLQSNSVYSEVKENMDTAAVGAAQDAIQTYFSSMFIDFRDELSKDANLIHRLSQFNRHPAVAITTGLQDTDNGTRHVAPAYGRFNGFIFDVNYYTVIGEEDLRVMAEVALLSQFNVTQYGRAAQ